MGTGYLLSVQQTQSDDGEYGATEADMAERFEESAHTLFVSLRRPGNCIDTVVLIPE
jgi:hypothetical protein